MIAKLEADKAALQTAHLTILDQSEKKTAKKDIELLELHARTSILEEES